MSAGALVAELRARGLALAADGDRLRCRGPKGALTPALCERMRARRAELLALLEEEEREIAWRAAAMRLRGGPLRARPDMGPAPGHCRSCGLPLATPSSETNCPLCALAAARVLRA